MHFRIFFIFSALLYLHPAFGQFAIVADKDGYVNVRDAANSGDNVMDTLHHGRLVYMLDAENGWISVDYNLEDTSRGSGYIHQSRLKPLVKFEQIEAVVESDSMVLFQAAGIRLSVSKIPVDISTFKEEGQRLWGTDGNVPSAQYGEMSLEWGGKTISLPCSGLYEPNLDATYVNFDSASQTLYVSAENGDGAGAYAGLWVLVDGNLKSFIITIPF